MTNFRKARIYLALFAAILTTIFISENIQKKNMVDVKPLITNVNATYETSKCIQCHMEINQNLVYQWEISKHAQNKVGCYECHLASDTDNDAYEHSGFLISSVITPADCGKCHEQEYKSFSTSKHANAAKLLSETNELVEKGYIWQDALEFGCYACHGTEIKTNSQTRRPSLEQFNNSGIGRINPDGSKGNCVACHYKHVFSAENARRAEPCLRCHSGNVYSQYEIWKSSKHGNIYITLSEINKHVDFSKRQVLGISKAIAPNCVTCHLGGSLAPSVQSTHDPSQRLAWKLSKIIPDKRENWRENRRKMQEICRYCHGLYFYTGFFQQFDRFIENFNQQFSIPAFNLINKINQISSSSSYSLLSITKHENSKYLENLNGNIDTKSIKFKADLIKLEYFKLWHNYARKAKLGAAMMSPQFLSWQGMFDFCISFYINLLNSVKLNFPNLYNEFQHKINFEK